VFHSDDTDIEKTVSPVALGFDVKPSSKVVP
jgi:hypothetical protein